MRLSACLAALALSLARAPAGGAVRAGRLSNAMPAGARLPTQQEWARRSAAARRMAAKCPCSDQALCDAVVVRHDREVFGFTAGAEASWKHLDWTQVTTVAWSTDPALLCKAHQHDVRLVASAPLSDVDTLRELGANRTARLEWVAHAVAMVQALHIDGITFDFEQPLPPASALAATYVDVIAETTAALHAARAGTQTSVCVAWSPYNIDGRYYDIKGFARAADLLYIMMYDTRSQIFDACVAGANAGLPVAQLGVQQYLDVGVPAEQLILGVPWYGYDYPCLPGTKLHDAQCRIKQVPFRGVNCSDAAGGEVAYKDIQGMLNDNATATGRQWDAGVSSPWYNYVKGGVVHQRWFDDAESLRLKYSLAKRLGLRGTGPYTYEDLDYSTSKGREDAAAMWEALHAFTD